MSEPLKIIMNGALGRMGQAIIGCAEADAEHFQIIARVDEGDDLAAACEGGEALIDFSHATVLDRVLAICLEQRLPLVIGTTGHSDEQRVAVAEAAETIPIVMAPNFSVGVNTLFWLTRKAAGILGEGYDLEVIEMHHRHKKDAPSGTARRLAEILTEARELSYKEHVAHGREGMIGERPAAEVGMHSMRGGDVVGDHTVVYATDGERVELTHKASSRDAFAKGALRAAHWCAGQTAGLYDMQDVLGLVD
jgi:4-hydroxy-tetrahydrodipicolinate reductase